MTVSSAKKLACVYVCDAAYLPQTCFSIVSLVKSSRSPPPVFLLHHGLAATAIGQAERYFMSHNIEVTLLAIRNEDVEAFPQPGILPKTSFGRLLLAQYLPSTLDRVAYFDGDTLIDRDVAALERYDLKGDPIGAVVDLGFLINQKQRQETIARLEMSAGELYFNSGVLLIDWKQWLSADPLAQSMTLLSKRSDRYTQGDQCVLNCVFSNRWRRMELYWNWQPNSARYNPEMRAAVFHFSGTKKPWNGGPVKHPSWVIERYCDYFKNSPWAAQAPRHAPAASDWLRHFEEAVTPRHRRDRDIYRRLVVTEL